MTEVSGEGETMSRRQEDDEGGCGKDLLTKLELIGGGGWFLWKIFLLCTIPSIMNGIHLTSYVYLAEVPHHWCQIPESAGSNWTAEEIRDISAPVGRNESSCEYYNWDYKFLFQMDFPDALHFVRTHEKPELLPCKSFEYENVSSIVVNYDLVCERTALKSMIQVSLSVGKFAGALVFGVLSDKYGRRLSFLMGCLLYVVSGPLVAFAANYSMIIAGRVGLGAASSGIYHSGFVILSEIASKKKRAMLGVLFNTSYPIGQMLVSVIALFCRNWRTLQVIISVPSVFMFVFYWFIPESPRWLILKGKYDEAGNVINYVYGRRLKSKRVELENEEAKAMTAEGEKELMSEEEKNLTKEEREAVDDKCFGCCDLENGGRGRRKTNDNIWKKFCSNVYQIIELLRYFELRSRLLVMATAWCVCSLCYYVLALNVDNFLTNRYFYGFLTGVAEIVSYILPLPLLKYFGRRHTSITLFYVGGLALLTILAIPRHEDTLLLAVASIGRLCASAVFAVVILHTTELSPTILRNTAIGCCSTSAHIGSMSAPFIVDLLGAIAWFIPSTVCGVVTLLVGTMIFILPETRNKPLPDTIDDIVKAPKNDKVGFHQICR